MADRTQNIIVNILILYLGGRYYTTPGGSLVGRMVPLQARGLTITMTINVRGTCFSFRLVKCLVCLDELTLPFLTFEVHNTDRKSRRK